MRLQDVSALVNFERQPFHLIRYISYSKKELKKVLQVMPIENKPHRASLSARAHLDGLLDEALEQTFPASDAVAIDFERKSPTMRYEFLIPALRSLATGR